MARNDRSHRGDSPPDLWEMLKPLARQNRREPTAAEQKLWQKIRNRQVKGVKFRRQHGIGQFIADFCSIEAMLVIEVDGATHEYTAEEDAIRQSFIEGMGYRVVRFTNQDVFENLEGVLETIWRMV